jgi:uncharacterized membrane protein YdjX (TVP38/TMEM64 family)
MPTEAAAPQTRSQGWLLLALLFASAAAIGAALIWLNGQSVVGLLRQTSTWGHAHRIELAVLYALVSFLSLCIVVPTGSLTMTAGGYILGYVAGPIFFVAMLGASALVHAASGYPLVARMLARTLEQRGSKARIALYTEKLMRRTEMRPILLTAMLRLVPVLPSAAVAFVARQLGVSARDQLLGTMATGWIRPMAYAALGASLPSVESFGSLSAMLQTSNPLALIGSSIVLGALLVIWIYLEITVAKRA